MGTDCPASFRKSAPVHSTWSGVFRCLHLRKGWKPEGPRRRSGSVHDSPTLSRLVDRPSRERVRLRENETPVIIAGHGPNLAELLERAKANSADLVLTAIALDFAADAMAFLLKSLVFHGVSQILPAGWG